MDKTIQELKRKIAILEKELERSKKTPMAEVKSNGKNKRSNIYESNKVLYSWKSPSRVFVKRNKEWFLKVAVIALVFILFAAFFQDMIVILVICVIVLIVFLLASVPPDEVEHKLTNNGIFSFDKIYKWEDLKEFWLCEKYNQKVLYISTKIRVTPRLVMLIRKKDENQIVKILGERLDYKQIGKKQGWLSKISDGVYIRPRRYFDLFKGKGDHKTAKKK